MAAAISGSAWSREAVKNESSAEAVLAEVILRISPPPQPFGGLRSVLCGVWKHARSTTSPPPGQAFAVRGRDLCKIWWGWQGLHEALSDSHSPIRLHKVPG